MLWLVLGGGILVGALHIGNAGSAVRQDIPANPITAIEELVRGHLNWPRGATTVAVLAVVLVVVLVGIARFRAAGRKLRPLTTRGVRQRAVRLGLRLGPGDAPGVAIGRAAASGRRLYGSYEDLHLDIWGPRRGKSSRR
ncbi:hypothetical protein [Nocardia crassostreae]|uniref:hypothetical protein n=1 Tax=Nocardia crassostreae TaxID=53428 RepID=UPI0008295740|nr:hypothetical protein [Nocardia crassostreae]